MKAFPNWKSNFNQLFIIDSSQYFGRRKNKKNNEIKKNNPKLAQ